MDLKKSEIEELLLRIANGSENPYRIYTGIRSDNLTPLLNKDGSFPYVRCTNAEETKLLALDSTYQIKNDVYRVTLVNSEPSSNNQYWISIDEGVTFEKVKFMMKQSRVWNSHWWLFLTKQ